MRTLQYKLVIAAGLLAVSWAQQQVRPIKKRMPEIEALFQGARWVRVDEGVSIRPSPYLRTSNLPPLTWLKPSQDADTVPNVPSTQPNFAGDTLLANNAGSDIDPAISSDCNHSFFDSLYAAGAWVILSRDTTPFFSNYLFPPSNMSPDTLFYTGGGIAERYDIDPCALAGSGNSIYIKGAATQILNKWKTRSNPDCDASTTNAPVVDDGDGVYTFYYELRDTLQFPFEVDVNDVRVMTYPGDTITWVSKPVSQVRIGWNRNLGQCVVQVVSRLERMDHAYFPAPVEVDRPRSFFLTAKFELYDPNLDAIQDTLFHLIGPAYGDGTHPCWTSDTMIVGRNHVLTPAYKQSASSWLSKDEWYPQYFLFAGRGYALNFLLFPIIYEAPGSSGGVTQANCQTASIVRSGNQGFSLPYPNPAVECINMKLNTPRAAVARFELLSTNGQLIHTWERPVPAGEGMVSLDLGTVAPGSYLLIARTPYGRSGFIVNVVR